MGQGLLRVPSPSRYGESKRIAVKVLGVMINWFKITGAATE
jgi:hypothetical protein